MAGMRGGGGVEGIGRVDLGVVGGEGGEEEGEGGGAKTDSVNS